MIIHLEDGVPPAKSKIVGVGDNFTGAIVPGGVKTEVFTPPAGTIWEVVSMFLKVLAPSGSGSGTHEFNLYTGSRYALQGKSVFGSGIDWDFNEWVLADSTQRPSSEEGAILALQGVVCDRANPLQVQYKNDTDVPQSGIRMISFYVKETPII